MAPREGGVRGGGAMLPLAWERQRGRWPRHGAGTGEGGRGWVREARGWAGWSGRDRFYRAPLLFSSLFVHHLFSVAGCLHCLPGIAYCLTTSSCVCVSSVCVPRAVSEPQLARVRSHVRAL